MKRYRAAALLTLLALPGPALGQQPIPAAVRGVWAADGACDGETVTFAADTLAYKGRKAAEAYFAPDDSPAGNGAIRHVAEGNVDAFEFDAARDVMVYRPEGYGMGSAILYTRCP